jgi:tRNA uridine 5-carboxymethylaminomethyl modification enzyme
MNTFDAIVVGGGHAGAEAASALARSGLKVALVTMNETTIGAMSCNPAIGGVGKSHLVFEIDALGGLMGIAADRSSIQARRLNGNKGPAVRSTRTQCDKVVYANTVQNIIKSADNIRVIAGEAREIEFKSSHEKKGVKGVVLADNSQLFARSVVVTSGTFMGGLMFCGDRRVSGGRFGDRASVGLSSSIERLGHKLKRLKTGTPARLKKSSIRFSELEKQWGDPEQRSFSWKKVQSRLPQICCYMTYTNEETHEVIRRNFDQSPLFSGDIVGVGPRYCPSVEDKVKRFPERPRHQIFLEPEGLDLETVYPNGMSTSLPESVQLEFLRTIRGLEDVELVRPGYAVEYDVIDPLELNCGLMSRYVNGLFFAGQVNRTSGYEEAAAQGLWAGLQASRYLKGNEFISLNRSRSYIDTLVSDLTTVGTEEPYRMFTSRSEYRLHLREDNANARMFALGLECGLIGKEQSSHREFAEKENERAKAKALEKRIRLDENRVVSVFEYLKRPEVTWETLSGNLDGEVFSDSAIESVEIEAKYAGYLQKQEREIRTLNEVRLKPLRISFDVFHIPELSSELREKIAAARPRNIEDLLSIQGMTPSAVLAIVRSNDGQSVSRETNN